MTKFKPLIVISCFRCNSYLGYKSTDVVISAGCTFDISGQGKFYSNCFSQNTPCNSIHLFVKKPLFSPIGVTGQHVVKHVKKAFKLEHELVEHNVRMSILAN